MTTSSRDQRTKIRPRACEPTLTLERRSNSSAHLPMFMDDHARGMKGINRRETASSFGQAPRTIHSLLILAMRFILNWMGYNGSAEGEGVDETDPSSSLDRFDR